MTTLNLPALISITFSKGSLNPAAGREELLQTYIHQMGTCISMCMFMLLLVCVVLVDIRQ